MENSLTPWAIWIEQLQAIAQNGLAYTKNPFDRERFLQLKTIATKIIAQSSPLDKSDIQDTFTKDLGYRTPKIDVRGVIFQKGKILLVQEKSDQLWTLPDGWADIGESPSQAIEREIFEETGYKAITIKLLALYDKNKRRPSKIPHTYKCFFLCDILGGHFHHTLKTTQIGWFSQDAIPPL
jgi:ADP-ribose pyrophosphatase YjhB (NUDIX family)